MKARASNAAPHPALLLLSTILFALAASMGATAQKFQQVFGGKEKEAGRGGVRPVTTGGFIAAGESFTPDSGKTSDIYVVRTEGNGTLAWSYTYDAGGNDSATDIEEVLKRMIIEKDTVIMIPPDSTDSIPMPHYEIIHKKDTIYEHDGYIVTGVTDNKSIDSTEGKPSRDLLLLRLDHCGMVIWWKTYGTDSTDEIGWDVDVTTVDNGDGSVYGDFIVAGSTTQDKAEGSKRNGYIVRVDAMGMIKWDKTYDFDNMKDDDYFYSLEESQIGKKINDKQEGVGDIIVCGGTLRYGATPDALVARVNGSNGTVTGPLHGFYVTKRTGADEYRSVIERRLNNKGFIVVFGYFTAGAGDRDVLGLELKEKPVGIANVNSNVTWGENNDDEAYEVREVIGLGSYGGGLIVTGYCQYTEGFGGKDAFLQKIDPVTFKPMSNIAIYGGEGTDWGWSVCPMTNWKPDSNKLPCRSEGFIMAGFTNGSFEEAKGEDLYLVKTDVMLKSGCNEVDVENPSDDALIDDKFPEPVFGEIKKVRQPKYTKTCRTWEKNLCYDEDGTRDCAVPVCPECMEPPQDTIPRDTIIGDTTIIHDTLRLKSRFSHTMVDLDRTGVLASYPNPVRRGEHLNLRYTLTTEGTATITVTDLLGNAIYRSTDHHATGATLKVVPTAAWPIGTYLVRMGSAERTATMRVVVVDR